MFFCVEHTGLPMPLSVPEVTLTKEPPSAGVKNSEPWSAVAVEERLACPEQFYFQADVGGRISI